MAQLPHATGKGPCALLHQPVQKARQRGQLSAGFDARLRSDVVAVEHHLAVVAPLQHSHHTQHCKSVGGVAQAHQAQAQSAQLHRLGVVDRMGLVAQLMFNGGEARHRVARAVAVVDFSGAEAFTRGGQADQFTLHVGTDR